MVADFYHPSNDGIYHKIPKNIESWIVSIVDKVVATYEFYESYGKEKVYKLPNLSIILLLILHW